jgi:hypothetical protein
MTAGDFVDEVQHISQENEARCGTAGPMKPFRVVQGKDQKDGE